MKFCKTGISMLLTAAVVLNLSVFSVESTLAGNVQSVADSAYERASNLFSGLDIISCSEEQEPQRTVTRGEFAGYLLDYMNMEYPETEDNITISSVAADEWEWSGETADVKITPTCFYDVYEEHPQWNKIKTAVEYGLMKGDGQGYFRPDDFVKNEELFAVLVESLGMKELTYGQYPDGYARVAADKQLTKNLKNVSIGGAITFRDMIVAMYNALFTDVYELSATGVITQSDNMFLTQIHKLYEGKGIVESNGISALDTQEKVTRGYYKIDGTKYKTDKEYTKYLGYRVIFYYDDADDESNILYMYPEVGENLVVYAKDIVDYKKPYLMYADGEKTKKQYLGAQTSIIYNGKALLDYEEQDLKIQEGKIEFVDNNNDGEYEVAVIENVETFYIDAVDNREKIIYAAENNACSISFDNADYYIYDVQGTERDFEAVNKNMVISVCRTLPAQGKSYINAVISSAVLVGKVTGVKYEDDIIFIDSLPYEMSYIFDGKNMSFNVEYTFALTADGKVAYAEENTDLKYGYLIKMASDELETTYSAKMFSLDLNSIEKYTFGEKVIFNGKNSKTVDAVKALMQNGETIAQLIRYSAAEGRINEILTANANDELFAKTSVEFEGKTLKFRNNINCFIDENETGLPLFYTDSSTYFINIPKTDMNNEDAYYLKQYYVDNEYSFDEIYVENKNNAVAKVFVQKSDSLDGKTITNSTTLSVVKKVTGALDAGEEALCIEVMNKNGTQKYYLHDTERFEEAKKLKLGDLIKLTTSTRENGAVANFRLIFDVDEHKLIEGKNPLSASSSFISQSYIMHGRAASRSNDNYLVIAPYEYSIADDIVTKGEVSQTKTKFLTIPVKSATVFIVDDNGIRIAGADENIMDEETTGTGSEIVAYTYWENPQLIVVYK